MKRERFFQSVLILIFVFQTMVGSFLMSKVGAVSYDMVVAKDGSGNFTTVQAAINSVPSNSQTRTTIFIKNGTYKEKINISSSKINISLIGESKAGTILTYNDAASTKTSSGGTLGTTGSASVTIAGAGFQAENITFENSYDEAAYGSSQAVAVLAKADKIVFKGCSFKGNQDTLYANGDGCRQYYYNCYIEGDVDFIFGSANAVFDTCEIFSLNRSGGCVTAPSTKATQKGYLIYKCKLTSSSSPKSIYLGRPWIPSSDTTQTTPMVLYRECELGSHIADAGWTVMSGNNPANFEMWEYQNTGAGANTSRKQLPSSKAADYTMEKFLSGSDGWNPNVNENIPVTLPDGHYIKSLIVNDTINAANWSVQSNLQVGDLIYGDRTYKFTQVPQSLMGCEWIRTACDSKMYSADEASYIAKSDITVYVSLDTRVTSTLDWLSSWTATGETLVSDNSSVAYNLYKKDFPANSLVTLGTNGASTSTVNYAVIVKSKTTGVLSGDLNEDGTVSALDFALLRKYILTGIADGVNLTAADVNNDGNVNALDYALLKSYLLSGN